MYSRHQRKVKLLLGLADAALTAVAFWAAYESRHYLPFERNFYLLPPVAVLLAGFSVVAGPLIGHWVNAYERLDSAHADVILRDSLKQALGGMVGLVLLQYALRMDLSRAFVGLFGLYYWLLLCLFRLNAGNLVSWIRRRFGHPHSVLIVGTGQSARRHFRLLESSAHPGLHLLGFLSDEPGAPADLDGHPVHALSELPALLEHHAVDEVIFAVPSHRLAALEEVFLLCDEDGVRTRVAIDFFPHVNSDVYLDHLQSAPLLTFSAAPHDEIRLFLKRITDVLLAGAALVLVAPLMLAVAAVIRMSSPGPAIFRQLRCGLNGRLFTFYKFRSMVDNAEQLRPGLEHLNHKQVAFKIPNDPRLTAIGRYLRRYSIDEWPQLWNVLRGDMSLVGPRPAVPTEVERYQRWQRRRLRMRPGLTCLWALEGRDALDFDTWMRKDMEYIDNWSLALDLRIMLKTVPRVISGRGAH